MQLTNISKEKISLDKNRFLCKMEASITAKGVYIMKFNAGNNEKIEINMNIVISALRAIEKAVCEDVPNELRENRLETNNRIGGLRGDWINQNLRQFTVNAGGILHPFTRYGWRGRMIVDQENKISYSIVTRANLRQIPRKLRRTPHFLQTVLVKENGDLRGHYEQMALFDMSQFDQEVYEQDFDCIFYGAIDPSDGYRHCVICYEAVHDEVISTSLLLLDPNFNVVNEMDLCEYRKPDFSKLTVDDVPADYSTTEHNEATRNLLKLKQTLPKIKGHDQAKES